MATERKALKVPELPESVADATVIALHKKAGDPIRRDELLAELETDKVVLEVPSPVTGILESWAVEESAVVTADALLGYLLEGMAAAPPPGSGPAVDDEPAPAARVPSGGGEPAPASVAAPVPETRAESHRGESAALAPEARAAPPPGPAVRRLLQEHGLAADAIAGTGPSGRLLREDVERHLETRSPRDGGSRPEAGSAQAADVTERSAMREPASSAPVLPEPTGAGAGRRDERVPMSRLRARIAERLLRAKQETAMLTTFNEVDLSAIMALRDRHKDAFEKRHGTRLGFMGFFVIASAAALRRFAIVNAEIDGHDIVHHDYIDIGIAVSSPRGLVVPVLRDADRLDIAEVERRIRDFGERAREGKLALDELRGGTFTITNGGVFGSMLSTPILNPPQSAILGMHAIQERPVARDGAVVIRPMMYLALSYDHRLIDGADAVRFLVDIRNSLEDPARLLLDL